jgi:predicted permease
MTPLDGRDSGTFYLPEGAPPPGPNEQQPIVLDMVISPGYFEAMGMRMVAGRGFTEQDTESGPRVAVIDESFAKRFFPNVNPLGKRIRHSFFEQERIEIVGITRDVKHLGLDREVRPSVFLNYRQDGVREITTIVLRTGIDPGALAASARETLRRMDPEVAMFETMRMTEAVDRSLWARRLYSWMAGAFAVIALTLAAGGMYGVISYAVSQRTREIGIRIALGATPARVKRGVLSQGLVLLAVGLPIGVTAALGASGYLEKLLLGVRARDPITYVIMGTVVAGVALIANWIPARRAATIEPMRALRSE